MVGNTNIATVLLFWFSNMADVTSSENALWKKKKPDWGSGIQVSPEHLGIEQEPGIESIVESFK